MLFVRLLLSFVVGSVCANAFAVGQLSSDIAKGQIMKGLSPSLKTEISTIHNHTVFDVEDNVRVYPNQFKQEYMKPVKKLKKNPKRTIQKIIKKNRSKKKMMYERKETTKAPEQLEFSQEVTEASEVTVPPMRKAKSHKVPKYPPPIHKLQFKKDSHKRQKRKLLERDNVFILKDFDGTKFLSKDHDDNDVVSVSGKKFW